MARKFFGFFALLAVLAVGFVGVRAMSAQGTGGTMGMMSMMNDCPMMGGMMGGPDAVLRHKAELGLSDEQVQRLQVLQNSTPDRAAMMKRMQEIHGKMNAAARDAAFDEGAARAAMEEMAGMHTDMGVFMLRTQHQVRQILTPEQREKLRELGRGGMMGGMMMGGMMKNCPMMNGGMMGGSGGTAQT